MSTTLAALPARPGWQAYAACHGMTDLFFPERGENTTQAKAVCDGCPVQPEYAAYSRSEQFGIWAGLSARERRRLRNPRTVDVDDARQKAAS